MRKSPKITKTRIVPPKSGDTEFIVLAYGAGGERLPACDYFTDDREDAEFTARMMRGALSDSADSSGHIELDGIDHCEPFSLSNG